MVKAHDDNRLVLEGEWDLSRRDELVALFGGLHKDGEATIDLRGVTYADSTFLNEIAALALKFEAVPITLLDPRPSVLRVLKLVNFDKLFRIVGDE